MTSQVEHFSWFALQVRTRHESGVAGFLEAKGYELFLPLITSRKQWSDRLKKVATPLFPGYVFCRFNVQERLPILKTPGVIQIVGYNRAPVPIEASEISAIQALAASGLPSQPWPFLTVGQRVRIEAGSLRGYEGLLVNFKGNHRLVLSISLLHRSVAVEIDSVAVSPLHTPHTGALQTVDTRFRAVRLAV
jgi:transcription antitermination factor NusG